MYFDDVTLEKIFNTISLPDRKKPSLPSWTFKDVSDDGKSNKGHEERLINLLRKEVKKTGTNKVFFIRNASSGPINFDSEPMIFPDIILDRDCFILNLPENKDKKDKGVNQKIVYENIQKNNLREFPKNSTDCGIINTCNVKFFCSNNPATNKFQQS